MIAQLVPGRPRKTFSGPFAGLQVASIDHERGKILLQAREKRDQHRCGMSAGAGDDTL